MIRCIVIKNCSVCPNHSHSGAFTQGGAWPVCHYDNIVNWHKLNKTLDYNDPKAGTKWSPPILPTDANRVSTNAIPDWCPLEEYK